MKFTCDRAVLSEAVSISAHAVLPRSSNPVLEGLLLSLSGDLLQLTGYDTETGIRCSISAVGEVEGQIVLPCSTFGDILRRLPDGEVEIEVQGERVRITCGAAEFNILAFPADSYPDVVFPTSGFHVTVTQKMLRSLINQTVFAVSQSDSKPVHTGCLFHIGGGAIEVVGVDGFRLALRKEPLEGAEEEAIFVVPGKTLQEISRIVGDSDVAVTLYVSGRSVVFETENVSVVTRTLEGEFLNYQQAIPKEALMNARVDVRLLQDCLDRASLLISEKQRSPVRIRFAPGLAHISCSTPLGRVNDSMPIVLQGDEVEMGFNNRFLQDALKHCGESELVLEMSSSVSPMVLRPVESEAFTFLVLPVRLKSEG